MIRDTAHVLIPAGIIYLAYVLPAWAFLTLCASIVIGFRLFLWFEDRC